MCSDLSLLPEDALQVFGPPSRHAQDLLRTMKLPRSLFRILSFPFEERLRPIYSRAYHLLRLFVAMHSENAEIILLYIPVMLSHMGFNLRVADVLIELFQASHSAVSKLTRSHLESMCLFILKNGRKPRYAVILRYVWSLFDL